MIDNKNEEFPIVDEMGNILGAVTRGHAHDGSKILHPVVHLHVFNSRGDLYLQHRPAWKDIQPDKWDTACGGHVDLGESVSQALHREVRKNWVSPILNRNLWDIMSLRVSGKRNWFMYIAVYMMAR